MDREDSEAGGEDSRPLCMLRYGLLFSLLSWVLLGFIIAVVVAVI